MAKTLTVARQLASLNPEQRALAISFARDLAAGAVPKKRRYVRRKPQAKRATTPKAARESKPRLPKAPPKVRPLVDPDEE